MRSPSAWGIFGRNADLRGRPRLRARGLARRGGDGRRGARHRARRRASGARRADCGNRLRARHDGRHGQCGRLRSNGSGAHRSLGRNMAGGGGRFAAGCGRSPVTGWGGRVTRTAPRARAPSGRTRKGLRPPVEAFHRRLYQFLKETVTRSVALPPALARPVRGWPASRPGGHRSPSGHGRPR